MYQVRLNRYGRIYIPTELRKLVGFSLGDKLGIIVKNGFLEIVKSK